MDGFDFGFNKENDKEQVLSWLALQKIIFAFLIRDNNGRTQENLAVPLW
jgi:hypothetical protein